METDVPFPQDAAEEANRIQVVGDSGETFRQKDRRSRKF